MKKKAVQKMLTMLIVSTMIVGSVPVSAQTVSENEGTAIEVTEVTPEETTDAPESEAKLPESEADNIGQAEETELPAEKEAIESGKIDGFSYSVYEETDESGATIRYAEITRYINGYGKITIQDHISVDGVAVPVTSIGDYAFYNCSGLTSITIPESVTSIGDRAFSGCSGLTSVTLPESVTSIGDYAFEDCSGLTAITVAEGNTVYDSRNNCNAIIEKETNTLITGCQNTVIPESVTSIGDSAFSGCSGLTSITIPESVTRIRDNAFADCSGLTAITVAEGNTVYDSRNNCNAIIEKETNTLITGCQNTVIPESVTSIGDSAFSGCSGLTSITIPESVTSIGDNAFAYCSGLTTITLPGSVTSIGICAFEGCSGLEAITIPEGVTIIGDRAFEGCSGLTSITIPDSVTRIRDNAFAYCSGLTAITVAEGNTVYDSRNNCNAIIEKETNTLIVGCQNTVIPDNVTSIGDDAFFGCSGLEAITIPEGVTSIGSGAFLGCSGLEAITIPEGVTSIGSSAFLYCSGLKDIYYGGSEEEWHKIEIGEDAFTYYDEEDEEYYNINYTLHCNGTGSVPGASQAPAPSGQPTAAPSQTPSGQPTAAPSQTPSGQPTVVPSQMPSTQPTAAPSQTPSGQPTAAPSQTPSTQPTAPSQKPGGQQAAAPSQKPGGQQAAAPSQKPGGQQAEVPAPGTKLEASGRAFQVAEAGAGKKDSKPEVILTNLSKKDKKAKKVTIPKTVKIGDVEYQVTAIAPKALKNSKKLQSIVIPDTITEIGEGSFEGCTALKNITIGKNVTTIGKNAFKNCKKLKKITVKSTKLKKVGKSALSGVHKKCVIKVPKKKLTAYKKLFKGKGQKKTVKITK